MTNPSNGKVWIFLCLNLSWTAWSWFWLACQEAVSDWFHFWHNQAPKGWKCSVEVVESKPLLRQNILNISKDWNPTASLDNLLQCSTTLFSFIWMELTRRFLKFIQNFFCRNPTSVPLFLKKQWDVLCKQNARGRDLMVHKYKDALDIFILISYIVQDDVFQPALVSSVQPLSLS